MFTPELILDFQKTAARIANNLSAGEPHTETYRLAWRTAMADLCNELLKHHKPVGCSFSQCQAEVIRDSLLDEYIAGLIHLAMVEEMRKLPAYIPDLLAEAQQNHATQMRVNDLELVLANVCGVKPEINIKEFCTVEQEPMTKLFMLAVNPAKLQAYGQACVAKLKEIPVMVNGERITN